MRRARKIRFLIAAMVLWAALVLWVGLDYRYRPRFIAGPMVQMVEPGGFTLTWSLHPDCDAALEILPADGAAPLSFDKDGLQSVRANGSSTFTITGLSPGTSYRYRIRSAAWGRPILLHEDTLRTAPFPLAPFRFIAFGDSGDGGWDQRCIAARLAEFDPDLVIHTGDLVYDYGRTEDYPARFYRPYATLIAHVPFYPCLGNHDFRTDEGAPFLDAFILPRNGPSADRPEREFWFDYGPARFVAIDSNHHFDALAGMVAPWLDEVLSSAGNKWKIVFFHEPVYTSSKHTPADKLLRTVVPVLDKHRVELVLHGHNHLYERTHPMRNGVALPLAAASVSASGPASQGSAAARSDPGTVYATTGAGGAGLYEEQLPAPVCMAAWYHERHSFTVVDVARDQLRLRQINDRGETVDETLIVR